MTSLQDALFDLHIQYSYGDVAPLAVDTPEAPSTALLLALGVVPAAIATTALRRRHRRLDRP